MTFAGVVGVRTVFLVGGGICLVAAAVSWLLFRADRVRTPDWALAPTPIAEVGHASQHVAEA